jgi:hypothetical protein
MANFRTHLAGAGLAGGAAALTAIGVFGRAGAPLAGAAIVATALGGLLPDVDHDHAVPVRELFAFMAAVLPTVGVPALTARGVRAEWVIVAVAVAYVAIRFGLATAFKHATVHRGIFHSIPFALCAGEVTALTLRALPLHERLFLGGAVALGALVHLVLDEVFAVDFTGKRLRKSFGTAIKFRAPSALATLTCYAALAAATALVVRDVRAATGR